MTDQLGRVMDGLPALVWSALPDGHVDFVNSWWRQYTGLAREDAYGRGWQVAIHPDDLAGLSARWRSIQAGEVSREMDARLRRADGEYRWFRFQLNPSPDGSGQIVRWCGIGIECEDTQPSLGSHSECWWLSSSGRENHFRSIVDGLPVLVMLMTPAGDLELANRPAREYFDAALKELNGWASVHTLYHPDDSAAVVAAWKVAVDFGRAVDCEARLRRVDGDYRWFHIRRTPLRDTDGRVVFWHLQQSDIDDRKRAEAQLLGEKQLLEMVAGGAPMTQILEALCRLVERTAGSCYCSIVLVDSRATRLEHGAAPSLPASFITSIIGRPVNVDSGPCAMAAYLNEPVIATDLRSETRWAEYEWCPMALSHGLQACWSTPIASASGKALGAFAVYYEEPRAPTSLEQSLIKQFTHIASIAVERAQADAALKRSEAFLVQGQQVSQTGSLYWRVAAGEITWSEETYRIFEFDPGPVTLDMIRSRVHPDDLPMFFDMLQRAATDGSDFEYEHRLQMPDQSVKYLHLVARGVRDEDGQIEYIGAVQDVTRRRLAEEALGRARTELAHVARVTSLGTLTASITHEVSQPLVGVITNSNICLRMLAADPPDVDGARETVRRTLRDGNRASDVITRLRALFAKRDVAMKSLDLNEATREVVTLSLSELQRSRAVVHLELAEDLPSVTGDRVQLQQVILNLLLNATDAMRGVEDRPRQVVIRTERDDERVRLSVQDTGVGVAAEDLPRVFEAFYTTKSDGMGIGLSVSRSIIQSHQGRLSVTPNADHGVTFTFSIPCRAVPEPGVSVADVIVTSATEGSMHILRQS